MTNIDQKCYRVVVLRNLVCEIRPIPVDVAQSGEDDPLAISMLLAHNNRVNGCLDGEYDFTSFDVARHFATLCADYVKNCCERSIDAMNGLDRLVDSTWRNPFIPTPTSGKNPE